MSLPVKSFATPNAGIELMSLLDLQFAAVSVLTEIPCTATGTNTIALTPGPNTPTIAAYSALTPKFVFTQAATCTGAVTVSVAGLAALNGYRSNGAVAIASGDLLSGASYTAFYVPTLNSGAGGFVIDAPPSSGKGNLVSVVNYTPGGSVTITIPSGASQAYVRMWGATGGSGGTNGGGSLSGGTGAGGYLEKLLTSLTPGNTLNYTQGTGGAAGTSGSGNGGNGTVTTLASGTQTISTLTCNASNGSLGEAGVGTTAGTSGGTATGGDINVTGQTGCGGQTVTINTPGPGGRNFFSVGADGQANLGAIAGNAGNSGGMIIRWMS